MTPANLTGPVYIPAGESPLYFDQGGEDSTVITVIRSGVIVSVCSCRECIKGWIEGGQ